MTGNQAPSKFCSCSLLDVARCHYHPREKIARLHPFRGLPFAASPRTQPWTPRKKSPLLRSTFYEVLRTCGGTVANRVVTEGIVVAGRLFKKGTPVMLPDRPHHMDPAIWGEGYGQFVPDRSIRAEGKGGKFGNRGDKSQGEVDEKGIERNGRPKRC